MLPTALKDSCFRGIRGDKLKSQRQIFSPNPMNAILQHDEEFNFFLLFVVGWFVFVFWAGLSFPGKHRKRLPSKEYKGDVRPGASRLPSPSPATRSPAGTGTAPPERPGSTAALSVLFPLLPRR